MSNASGCSNTSESKNNINSLHNDESKLRLKDAIVYLEHLYLENNLLAQQSSATISHESMQMGEDIYEFIFAMLSQKVFVETEELLLSESDNECSKEFQGDDSWSEIQGDASDDEYEPPEKESKQTELIPLEYKIKTVNMFNEHPKWNSKRLQKKGGSPFKINEVFMHLKAFVISVLVHVLNGNEDLVLLSKTHTTPLEKYVRYIDSVILHFHVPPDINFVSFKFEAEEIQLSIFPCKPKNVTVYLKHGSPPVINPDGSKFPKGFFNFSRPMQKIEFKSEQLSNYINTSSPAAGSYFAVAFISYTDPRLAGITQKGLTPNCETIVTASLLVNSKPKPMVVISNVDTHVLLEPKSVRIYKFFVYDVDFSILYLRKIEFCKSCTILTVKIQAHRTPFTDSLYTVHLKKENYNKKMFMLRFLTVEDSWYYVSFKMDGYDVSQFVFEIENNGTIDAVELNTNFTESDRNTTNITKLDNHSTFKRSILRNYQSQYLDYNISYKQYNLIRSGHTESFLYSFDLHAEVDAPPIPINMTNKEVMILKFRIKEGIDVGGTMQFGLAFKPRVISRKGEKKLLEEPINHSIIGCLRNGDREIPTWPNKCSYQNFEVVAPLVLNSTVKNSTVFVPYPEPGNWYASFKLFCGECKPCKCPEVCKKEYKDCHKVCEMTCKTTQSCHLCIEKCEAAVFQESNCTGCDCEGPCLKSSITCNSSLLFAIASYPCVTGHCGANGKCVYMIAEGFSYSLCFCTNKYKGWDCSDDSAANSKAMIIMELLFLVLSNLAFLPACYVAYRRHYYVEAIVYFSTFFFSSTYHACDSGENIYTVCITRLSVLQFSDFFCGLLSIWVTIIAIAYLPNPWPSIFHITGAIILAFITTMNKTSLFTFVAPFATGILILIVSWYRRYRKTRRRFPSDRYLCVYLPIGIIIVAVGLITYALLQTQSNYMYLHSLWHILIATSIIILLPNRSFLPTAIEPIVNVPGTEGPVLDETESSPTVFNNNVHQSNNLQTNATNTLP
ncbi:hypothetical protein FQA39_LY08423 [Lamprigera yunnana]|nr:hypothetical protein FQA39_LY08423 [Lamprigera yunnana]